MKNAYQMVIHVITSLIVVTTAMNSMAVRYFLISLAKYIMYRLWVFFMLKTVYNYVYVQILLYNKSAR